ncbi:MAG: hypothetical protein M3O02_08485 [Acidobacteriota bacterium]|nr:hypothetical protein [Acidobacteriota bacterium]
MIPNRTTLLTTAAAFTLAFSGAIAHAQAGSVPTAKPSEQPAAQPAEAPNPPAYIKQGEAPSAADPIPAPTSPVPPTDRAASAQPPPASATDTITPAGSDTPRNWTTDQILTATVHQAWILAGKDEANFFQIVQELAAISASNRNLSLPDSPDAGRKAGAYIRTQAKDDHDQLLYDIVDKAVRMTGTKSTAPVGSSSPAGSGAARATN